MRAQAVACGDGRFRHQVRRPLSRRKVGAMGKNVSIALAVLAVMIGSVQAQTDIGAWKVAPADPILTVGHGAIFDSQGKEINPSPEFIIQAQQFYLKRLFEQAGSKLQIELTSKQQRLQDLKGLTPPDQILVNSALIAWLIESVKPADAAHLASKSGALRNRIFRITGKQSATVISKDVLRFLDEERLISYISPTTNGGQPYIDECRANRVPIPPDWGPARASLPTWDYGSRPIGTLRTKFIIRDQIAEVFKFENSDGICLALPRRVGDTITALGIICMNRESGKTCFWDNINVTPAPPFTDDINSQFRFPFDIPRGVRVPLSIFAGGADLFGGNGVCSDCHAGNNPFIVHPTDAMDVGEQLLSNNWPEPLVDPRWPQNPGPTTLLEGVPRISANTCLNCHNSGRKLRFPEVSNQLPGYCTTVLRDALGIGLDPTAPIPAATMPWGDVGNPNYQSDIDALLRSCSQPPIPIPLRVVVNGATQAQPGGRIDQSGDLGVCTGGDCPIGFCYWRTLHGPFWQRTDASIPFGAAEYRGSFLRIFAEGGRWRWRDFSDAGGPLMAAPGGTAECMIFRNISGVPNPNNCGSTFATIFDPTGTRLSDSSYVTSAGSTANALTGFIGNVAQAAFGRDQMPDTLRIVPEVVGSVVLFQRHTDSLPSPLAIGPLTGEAWINGCERWTPTYLASHVYSLTDVELVPAGRSREAFCFITGITGAWSTTGSGGAQPFAEIYNGTAGEIRLRVSPSGGPDGVGAYASCIKFR